MRVLVSIREFPAKFPRSVGHSAYISTGHPVRLTSAPHRRMLPHLGPTSFLAVFQLRPSTPIHLILLYGLRSPLRLCTVTVPLCPVCSSAYGYCSGAWERPLWSPRSTVVEFQNTYFAHYNVSTDETSQSWMFHPAANYAQDVVPPLSSALWFPPCLAVHLTYFSIVASQAWPPASALAAFETWSRLSLLRRNCHNTCTNWCNYCRNFIL